MGCMDVESEEDVFERYGLGGGAGDPHNPNIYGPQLPPQHSSALVQVHEKTGERAQVVVRRSAIF